MNQLRSGFVGLLGLPNAGKSSLFNALMAEPLSIVTSKAQTTRKRMHGIHNQTDGQIIFIDSPGFVSGSKKFDQFLLQEFYQIQTESDVLIWVIAPTDSKSEHFVEMRKSFLIQKKPWFIVFNKADLGMDPEIKQDLIDSSKTNPQFKGHFDFCSVGKKVYSAEILNTILNELPASASKLYPEHDLTLQSMRDLACEYVREACFNFLNEEVPYLLTTSIRSYQEQGKLHKISMDIVVGKRNHLPIVVGRGASMIKKIGETSRKKIENLLGTKVFLDLQVRVHEKWTENPAGLKEYGYELSN